MTDYVLHYVTWKTLIFSFLQPEKRFVKVLLMMLLLTSSVRGKADARPSWLFCRKSLFLFQKKKKTQCLPVFFKKIFVKPLNCYGEGFWLVWSKPCQCSPPHHSILLHVGSRKLPCRNHCQANGRLLQQHSPQRKNQRGGDFALRKVIAE